MYNESVFSEFSVHNNKNNPPDIKIIAPIGGQTAEKAQVITIGVRDLEDNIDPNGVFYYYSSDKLQWSYIGNMAVTRPDEPGYYDIKWFTDKIPDGEYWLNVTVSDTTNLKSWDVSEEPIIIHNTNQNPPIVRFVAPSKGQYIDGTFKVQV